jgi:hypothetical protein
MRGLLRPEVRRRFSPLAEEEFLHLLFQEGP